MKSRILAAFLALSAFSASAWSQATPTPPPEFLQSICDKVARHMLVPEATPGTMGLPVLTVEGSSLLGDHFALRVSNVLPGAHGCMIYSPSEMIQAMPQYGGVLHPGPVMFTWPFTTDNAGVSPPILELQRVNLSFMGVKMSAQAIVLDPKAQGGVAFTDALRVCFGDKTQAPMP